MKLATAAQMREMDRTAIHDVGIPGVVLMENAGRTTVQVIVERFGPLAGKRAAILCGGGNNGGDGCVIARYLHKMDCRVHLYLLTSMDRVKGDAKTNLDICRRLEIPLTELTEAGQVERCRGDWIHAGLVIDALLGTGLNAEVRGLYAEAIAVVNELPAPVVSVDVPSGLDSDRGVPLGSCVRADLTVTYGMAKTGLVVYPGREYAGELFVADIGIPQRVEDACSGNCVLLDPTELAPPEPRRPDSHKGRYGHLLIVAGSPGKTGAAAMASEAAARSGAGLVTLAVPNTLHPILEAKTAEVMTEGLADTPDGFLAPEAIDHLLTLLEGKTALAVGPGLSTREGAAKAVKALLGGSRVPVVIDADGLNILASDLGPLKAARCPAILTPHPGEMARLMKTSVSAVQADRLGAARTLARECNVVVVLKGAATVVALPDGRAFINSTGNPGMASGGMGDILTGIIGGLLTQGVDPAEAAKTGVYVHGLCADRCAATAPVGYLASDLLIHLPSAMADLRDPHPADLPSVPLVAAVFSGETM